MSKVKSKNSKIELKFRKELWKYNVRYRLHCKKLPGKPDIIMRKHKLAIFIDGDFWHGYNWDKRKSEIKLNRLFWINKIERNIQRDIAVNNKLKDLGFTVMRFWEHDINKKLQNCINQVLLYIEAVKQGNLPDHLE